MRNNKTRFPMNCGRAPQGDGITHEMTVWIPSRAAGKGAKVLVFERKRDLDRFWKHHMGYEPGTRIAGLVNGLFHEVIPPKGEPYNRVDPNFFCVMAFLRRKIETEVVMHESVHAGYAYARRKLREFWISRDEFDEEHVAYPAGIVADAITNAFRHWGLIS